MKKVNNLRMHILILKGHYTNNKINGGKVMDTIALILSIIGCINWGLVGIFQFDLVAWIFGGQSAILSRIIYALVGLAGLWCITLLFRKNRPCVDGE